MRDSVTVHVDAPAQRVWELVSDITNTGRLSPETFAAEWLDGATTPGVGVRFRGHVRRNGWWPPYWTTCRIVSCEPGRSFGFAVVTPRGTAINTWSYHFEPTDGGTDVTESFELSDSGPLRAYWKIAGRWRNRTNLAGMRTTLERLKTIAEAPDPAV